MSELRTSITNLEAASHAAFMALFAYSPIGVAIGSTDRRILIGNEALARFVGRAEEDLVGLSFDEITHPDYRDKDHALLQELLTGRRTAYTGERQFLRKDGKTVWGRVTVARVGEALPPSLMVAVIEDITARKTAEAEAARLARETAERSELFQTILDQLPVGVVVVDASERVIMRNEFSRVRLAPYAAEELSQAYAGLTAYRESGQEYSYSERPLARALHRGEPTDYEVMRLEREGQLEGYIYVIAAPVRNGAGKITAAALVYADITSLKETERRREETIESLTRVEQSLKLVNQEARAKEETMRQALDQILKQLEAEEYRLREAGELLTTAEQRERERLATLLHDDVVQSLAVIKMNLSALPERQSLEEINKQARTLVGVVDEAIAHTRSLVLDLAPPQLTRGGLREALPWWAQRIERGHGLKITVEIRGELGRLATDAEVTLFQAVKELVNNIVKHAHATEVQIVIDCSETRLEVLVSDNGEGFVPEAAAQETFGLSNIRRRLGYLGGEMSIDSAPGAGTRVRLRAPLSCGVTAAASLVESPA